MTTETAHHEAHSEKQHAALSSLFWALFLTLIKLGAGLATNSLGILSEALHSSLDLVAAGITFFAVRIIPGNPIEQMTEKLPADIQQQIFEQYGFDKPISEQYKLFFKELFLHGDLGESIK